MHTYALLNSRRIRRWNWSLLPMILCLAGCWSVAPVGRDDFPVASERQLFRLNSEERLAFLRAHEDTRIVVQLSRRGSQPQGIGITRLHVPAERWTVDRPWAEDEEAMIIRPDFPNDTRPMFVVVLPDRQGLVFPAGIRDSRHLLRYRAGRFDRWALPATETPVAGLYATAWIAEPGIFYLLGLERNGTLTLWEVSLSDCGGQARFREKAKRKEHALRLTSSRPWRESGFMHWSPQDNALYLLCTPVDQDTQIASISPGDLHWYTVRAASRVYGLSERGLLFVTRKPRRSPFDAMINHIGWKTIPDGEEALHLRIRGDHIHGGCLSPDGRYLLFTVEGFLHDPIDPFYGPALTFVWDSDSRKGFVVDTSQKIVSPLAWISKNDVEGLKPPRP